MGIFGGSLPPGCGTLPGEEEGAIDLRPYLPNLDKDTDVFWVEDGSLMEVREEGNRYVGDLEWNDDLSNEGNCKAAAARYLRFQGKGPDYDRLLDVLQERSSGRWEWWKIHCCITGKDADLEPWGQQGLQLLRVDEHSVYLMAHGLKTFAGLDVCLNVPHGESSFDEDRREAYLDAMYEVVSGDGWPGEWDGDSWIMSIEEPFFVGWYRKDDGTIDFEATATRCVDACEAVLKEWEDAMRGLDHQANVLAGWVEFDGTRCKEGSPGKGAAWLPPEGDE